MGWTNSEIQGYVAKAYGRVELLALAVELFANIDKQMVAKSTSNGPPTSGRWAVADGFCGPDGILWLCVAAGSPGVWVSDAGTAYPSGTYRGIPADPVADVAALKAVSQYDDGQTRLVKSVGFEWHYSATSILTPDDVDVVKPNDVTLPAPGRWLRETGSGGGSGWVRVTDVTVSGGSVDLKTYQDAAHTVLETCRVSSLSVQIVVKSAFPIVTVEGVSATLTEAASGGHYAGTVTVTLPSAGAYKITSISPDGANAASCTITISYLAPPSVLTLQFTGGYPGTQTELKAGDSFSITGTTDTAADAVEIQDFGAFASAVKAFAAGTTFTVTGTIADRGTSVQSLAGKVRARSATTGAYGAIVATNAGGGTVDGVNLVKLNNIYPSLTWGTPSYPAGQGALKDSEQATVASTVANYDVIAYTSPGSELSITNPSFHEATKTVTRIGGTYNISTTNLRATATRTANAATSVVDTVVKIAHTAHTIAVTTPAARLRSGGNNGTAAQSHTITITASQQLYEAPTMLAGVGGGTLLGTVWSGGPSVWTRSLQVHDDHVKGTYSWTGLVSKNLAGKVVNTITSGTTYVLGGFVARTLTFAAFSHTTALNVACVTYSKLQAGIFTATNQPALRNANQGNHSNIVDTYTVDALATNPTTIYWNDDVQVAGNFSGTAQITNVEEIV